MFQKVHNKIIASSSSSNQDKINVLILHRKNSVFQLFIKNCIERMEDEVREVDFYFESVENEEVITFMINYRVGEIPAILFFTKGRLVKKIEGQVSTIEFESNLKFLIKENERDTK